MSQTERAREIVDTLINMIADTRDNAALYEYVATALKAAERERDEALKRMHAARFERDNAENEWAQRYDDAVQPLQRRCSEYLARAEAAEAQLRQVREALEIAARRLEDASALLPDAGDAFVTMECADAARAALAEPAAGAPQ